MKNTKLQRRNGWIGEYVRNCLFRITPLIAVAIFASVSVHSASADTISVRVADGADDSEENPGGSIDLGSSDLEIGAQGGATDAQLIGLRFRDIDIPRGARISSANIQFTVDETDDEVQTMPIQIFGEIGGAAVFTGSARDISSRERTGVSIDWQDIPAWEAAGDAGVDQQTPDISPVIQTIVVQESWEPNDALVILLSPLAGFERTAESFNGDAAAAALLTIEFDPSDLILFGDFNDDGTIDSADYLVLQSNFHMPVDFGMDGDMDFNGQVNLTDFLQFRQAFHGGGVAAASVPEPVSGLLACMAFISLCHVTRRRRRMA